MATKIRLARSGTKKRPYYNIVVSDESSPRDGKFIEEIGVYNPLLNQDSDKRITLKKDRAEYWLSVGAQPTDRITTLFKQLGIAQDKKIIKDANEKLAYKVKAIKKANEERKKKEAEKAAAEAAGGEQAPATAA